MAIKMTMYVGVKMSDNSDLLQVTQYAPWETFLVTKLVIWLSVNRLPVNLPITGCIFKLPIIDLQTFFFT